MGIDSAGCVALTGRHSKAINLSRTLGGPVALLVLRVTSLWIVCEAEVVLASAQGDGEDEGVKYRAPRSNGHARCLRWRRTGCRNQPSDQQLLCQDDAHIAGRLVTRLET